MSTRSEFVATFLIGVLCLAIIAWFVFRSGPSVSHLADGEVLAPFPHTTTTSKGIIFGHSDDYGVAVRPEQVVVNTYIPPCDSGTPGFDYCIYRVAETYADTNFETAGVRIKERGDLTEKNSCLRALPEGYTNVSPRLGVGRGYTTSVFTSLGDAAAGHYSNGDLYRLHFDSTCYEFQTRIGESQFANYPKGGIKEFAEEDRRTIRRELTEILQSVTIASSSQRVVFPAL